MDTVGDAYVVIGLCQDENSLAEVCEEMIILARNMIITLEDFSSSFKEVCGYCDMYMPMCVCVCMYVYLCVHNDHTGEEHDHHSRGL